MNTVFFVILFSFVRFLSFAEDLRIAHVVSFVIPCYNCEKTIEESIASIYQQELSVPFEVICTDDCSTDATKLVLEKCSQKFSNLFIYFHVKNRGGGATRNTGTFYARGDLIFNLDSDNILIPHSIDKLINLIDQTGCDIAAFHHAQAFTTSYKEISRWVYDCKNNIIDLYGVVVENKHPVICQGNYLYTRKCFDLVNGYPEDCGALDTTGFGLALLAAGCKIATLSDPEMFYWHRLDERSYWVRESEHNVSNLQKALRYSSEIFQNEFYDLLWNKNRALECWYKWREKEFKLASPLILESLFKASRYKMEKRYEEAAKEFANAIKYGCNSNKISRTMHEMIDLSLN